LGGVTVGRALCVALVACLLVLGAAGLSSLEDEEFCAEQAYAVERSSWSSELAVWPPGWRCVFSLPDGRAATVEAGSVELFLGVLAGELLIAAWVVRRWPRVTGPARLAAVTMLVCSVAGAGGLVGGFIFAMWSAGSSAFRWPWSATGRCGAPQVRGSAGTPACSRL
jgi:hypothetical protein